MNEADGASRFTEEQLEEIARKKEEKEKRVTKIDTLSRSLASMFPEDTEEFGNGVEDPETGETIYISMGDQGGIPMKLGDPRTWKHLLNNPRKFKKVMKLFAFMEHIFKE